MRDEDKTKGQLIDELIELRLRLEELEKAGVQLEGILEASHVNEYKYRVLLENLPQRLFHKDKNSVYVSCNNNYARDLKIKPDEITGKTDYDFYTKELAEKYRTDDRRIIESGKTEDIEERYIRNGEEVVVHTVKKPVRDENGNTIGILGIWDIAKEKRAEKALEAAITKAEHEKNKSEAIIAALGDGIIIQDTDFKILYQNQIQKDIYGDRTGEYCYRAYMGRDTICEDCPVELSLRDGKIIAGIKVIRNITESKRLEEELRESERFLESIFASIQDGICIIDMDMNILLTNPVAEKWYQHAMPLAGKKCYEAYHGRSEGCEICPAWGTLRTGESAHEIIPKRGPGGKDVGWLEIYSFPMIDTVTGQMRGAIEYARDITKQKQAEEALRRAHDELEMRVQERTEELVRANDALKNEIAERQRTEGLLRESESRYRNLVESARDIILNSSPDGTIISLNPAFEVITGWQRAEWLGKNFQPLIHRDDLPSARNTFKRVLAGEILPSFEVRVLSKSGEYIMMELTVATQMHDGKAVSILGIARNITRRKHAEKKLQQSEEKYRTLIDNIQDGVFISQDAKIQFVNEAFAKITGYTVQEVIGMDITEFIAPENLEMVVDRYHRRQSGENIPKEYEVCILKKDRKTRVIINMNVGLITYRGRVASMGTVKDITEKKKLEAQLIRAQRMESIGTLAGGIAHDINNILTPIMLSLQLLRNKHSDEASQNLVNILERSANRGANMMKQIVSFARGIEGERMELQVTYLISEIKKIAKETFPRSIEIRTDVPKDLWAISGDATQLHQVLMNLCVNARDAMPDGGILTISAENLSIDESYARTNIEAKTGFYVTITVSDSGTGIPPGVMDRIFEPFFTTKAPGKGTGLGLPTALAIVKSHGGFINVYSETGKGTAFRVHLPAVRTTVGMQKAQEQQHELPAGCGEIIMVVDDEAQIREITRVTLESNGYKVIIASNGEEAVALYSRHKEIIRAVLMDMMMPVMDGRASIRALRKIDPHIRIIAVSGLERKDRLTKAAIANVHAFLPKPYTVERLLRTLRDVLDVN